MPGTAAATRIRSPTRGATHDHQEQIAQEDARRPYAEGQKWGDRFNGQVTVTGSNAWTVTIRQPQHVIATWNATVSWNSSGNVMTARPNGSGNSFGFTVQHGGNWTWPSLTCTAT